MSMRMSSKQVFKMANGISSAICRDTKQVIVELLNDRIPANMGEYDKQMLCLAIAEMVKLDIGLTILNKTLD